MLIRTFASKELRQTGDSSKEADLHIGRGSYNKQYSHTAVVQILVFSLVRYGQDYQERTFRKIYYDELKLMQPNAKNHYLRYK
ncbi:MAG: hypothetical protein CM15mV142_290 [Caudoviricetes sp.]|nr:MAG: hypothetical protein CM15mV142_290 [Caudoviricetes sp.]